MNFGDSTPYDFLGSGTTLAPAFRGEDLTPMAPYYGDATLERYDLVVSMLCKKHRVTFRKFQGRASNLGFFPRALEWDEEMFRSGALEFWMEDAPDHDPSILPICAVDTWLHHARSWMGKVSRGQGRRSAVRMLGRIVNPELRIALSLVYDTAYQQRPKLWRLGMFSCRGILRLAWAL
jgi:hypothetical protein